MAFLDTATPLALNAVLVDCVFIVVAPDADIPMLLDAAAVEYKVTSAVVGI